jgi:F420-dependent oxidoreductase-like protein
MKLGLQVVAFNWPGSPANTGRTLHDIAQAADEAGFTSLWVMDHYFQIEPGIGQASDPMLEAYTALSFMAGATQRIRLGAMVTGVIYRQPAFLVKQVSTLDVLSGGRANLGIGAAWYEREAVGLGFPYPPTAERFERLEETLQIANHLWSGNPTPYEGKHYRLPEPINSPQPLSQPHPPILVGGGGEKKTLRLVAQYADACNLFAFGGIDQLRHKLDVLKGHCDAVGRDYDAIERTALGMVRLGPGGMAPSELIDLCRGLAGVGIQQFIFSVPTVHEITPLETIGREVMEAVAEL